MFGEDDQLLLLVRRVAQDVTQFLELGLFAYRVDTPRQVKQSLRLS